MDEAVAKGIARAESARAAGRELVLAGPPSSGRTRAVIRAIRDRPVLSPGDGAREANVLVAHYAAVSDAAERARSSGIENVVCVNRPSDFRGLADGPPGEGPILVVCRDAHFARLCDNFRDLSVQRVVFDNIESLRARNYPVLRCEAVWLVCSPDLLDAPPSGRARTHREARMAARDGRAVLMPPGSAPPPPACERVLYREISTPPLLATIAELYKGGRRSLAASCLPCDNVRTADASRVIGSEAAARLDEACPVCYETRGPRVVVRCCAHNFCAECVVRHLQISRACPMCRAQVRVDECVSVSDASIPRIEGIAEETHRLLRRCLADPEGGKVLVVSGRGVDAAARDLLWYSGVDFVDIRGNYLAVANRLREFADGPARVAVVRNHEIKRGPVRTPPLDHVVFLGQLTKAEKDHWASRGAGPHSRRAAVAHSVESIYEDVFGTWEDTLC